MPLLRALINFDCTIDTTDKPIRRVEANGGGEKPIRTAHQYTVSEVEQGGHKAGNGEL